MGTATTPTPPSRRAPHSRREMLQGSHGETRLSNDADVSGQCERLESLVRTESPLLPVRRRRRAAKRKDISTVVEWSLRYETD